MSRAQEDRNQEATVYLVRHMPVIIHEWRFTVRQGNLDERCTDALVWELMLQAGPVGGYDDRQLYEQTKTRHDSERSFAQRPCIHGAPRLRFL